MHTSGVTTLAALLAAVSAGSIQGFNYGATHTDGSPMTQSDFESRFEAAKKLAGTNGAFTSARLYTMQQGGSSDVTSAIPAAIASGTHLLLGLWASGDGFASELAALGNAIKQYPKMIPLIDGISVGSEDLYRISPTGIENESGLGAGPDDLVKYIGQVRQILKGTALSGAKIGHVDTWTAWVNGSNSAVVDACDWVGVDAYPYFQSTMANAITDGATLFASALSQTKANAKGKEVWVTETGWPVSGKTSGQAIPNTDNAKTYWDDVGCGQLFGKVNTWWYTIQDAAPTTPNPSFGFVGSDINSAPLFDLSCQGVKIHKPSASSSSTDSSNNGDSTDSSSPSSSDGSSSSSGSSSGSSSSSSGSTSGSGSSSDSGSSTGSSTTSGSSSSPSAGAAASIRSIGLRGVWLAFTAAVAFI